MKWAVVSYQEKIVDETLRRLARQGGRAIDVGAGDGSFTRILNSQGWDAVACDLSLAIPEGHGPRPRAVRGDAQRLPFKDRSAHLVFAKDMLHHASDPDQALREMARVVRADGAVVLLEPNRRNVLSYFHLTLAGGHDHFTTKRFQRMAEAVFRGGVWQRFSAHVYPEGLDTLGRMLERVVEATPGLRRFRSYNAFLWTAGEKEPALRP